MSVTRTVIGGMAAGAAAGYGGAGPLGAVGGAFTGAILGAAADWWGGAQQPTIPDAPAPPLMPVGAPPPPNQVPITPAVLDGARRNLVPPSPIPRAPAPPPVKPGPLGPNLPPFLLSPAVLSFARANLTAPPPTPLRIWLPNPADAILDAARQALKHVPVPPPVAPRVVSLREQIHGMTLEELILPPPFVTVGRVVFRVGTKSLTGQSKPPIGCHTVDYRYVDGVGTAGPIYTTTLHIKPTVSNLMRAMNFAWGNNRWQLNVPPRNVKGRPHNFHLSVPSGGQSMPDHVDNLAAIFDGVFPKGVGMTGTHMSIEVSQGNQMNNAAYFLNGSPKSAQGFTAAENADFTTACRKALDDWKNGAMDALRAAVVALNTRG
ncbi:hypothetical protein ACE7GA_23625 [Roseomonas sp. CCTCC AB2023176]|uniref:hypothetical protein n=1 Tax=Roseomonas sp. CCTCC AB2023176 TaxID=3342640 RepID=UPI0035E0A3EF